MSKKNNRTVYKTKTGDWVNKNIGLQKTSSLHSTKKAAEEAARIMLKNQGGGELIIKGIDGKVRSKDSQRIPATYHVYRDVDGKWAVKKTGSNKANRSFKRRIDSVRYAKRLSKEDGDDLVIHAQNGRIVSKDSFREHPSKDK